MSEKIVLNRTAAVKDLVLKRTAIVDLVLGQIKGANLSTATIKMIFESVLSNVAPLPATPLMQQVSLAIQDVEKNRDFFDEFIFLCRISYTLRNQHKQDLDLLKGLLFNFKKYTTVNDGANSHVDNAVAYKLATMLCSHICNLYGSNTAEATDCLQLIVNNPLATTNDFARWHQAAPKDMRADILADMEKCARREITAALTQTVPDINRVKYIVGAIEICVARTYGKYSQAYYQIMSDYNLDIILKSDVCKYVSSMPDVYARQIEVLKTENSRLSCEMAKSENMISELKHRNEKLTAEVNDLRTQNEQYLDGLAELMVRVDAMRPSLLSRGVKLAQQQALTIKQKLSSEYTK